MGGRGCQARRPEGGARVRCFPDRKSRSASLFRKLASKVNTAGCQDRAFLRFKELLQAWFPPVSSASGNGQPNDRPRGRTHSVERETRTRKKLIEVALPLDDINAASAREKSIRHGHPEHVAPVVGATSSCRGARSDLRATGRLSVGSSGTVSHRKGPGARAQALFGIVRSSSSGRTRPTRSCWTRRGRSGRAGVGPAPTTPSIRERPSCSIPDRLPAFHDPFAGGGALRWRRRGSAWRRTPATSTRGGADQQGDDRDPAEVRRPAAREPGLAGRADRGRQDVERGAGTGRRRAVLRTLDARRRPKSGSAICIRRSRSRQRWCVSART